MTAIHSKPQKISIDPAHQLVTKTARWKNILFLTHRNALAHRIAVVVLPRAPGGLAGFLGTGRGKGFRHLLFTLAQLLPHCKLQTADAGGGILTSSCNMLLSLNSCPRIRDALHVSHLHPQPVCITLRRPLGPDAPCVCISSPRYFFPSTPPHLLPGTSATPTPHQHV
jgi:hypothetical protein